MAYTLRALVAGPPAAARAAQALAAPTAVLSEAPPLRLILLPDTADSDLAGEGPGHDPAVAVEGAVAHAAVEASRIGPVAYLEAEYFGGAGGQTGVVWRDGALVWGPHGSDKPGPINEALGFVGVVADEAGDAFETVGLGRYRSNDEWLGAISD